MGRCFLGWAVGRATIGTVVVTRGAGASAGSRLVEMDIVSRIAVTVFDSLDRVPVKPSKS